MSSLNVCHLISDRTITDMAGPKSDFPVLRSNQTEIFLYETTLIYLDVYELLICKIRATVKQLK